MGKSTLSRAVPILASLNISETIQFYCTVLGFTKIHEEPVVYGIARRDSVEIHFWACSEIHIAENTACRIKVEGIDSLYAELQPKGVIHNNASLQAKPWGTYEFGILDEDGNLVTFGSPVSTVITLFNQRSRLIVWFSRQYGDNFI